MSKTILYKITPTQAYWKNVPVVTFDISENDVASCTCQGFIKLPAIVRISAGHKWNVRWVNAPSCYKPNPTLNLNNSVNISKCATFAEASLLL